MPLAALAAIRAHVRSPKGLRLAERGIPIPARPAVWEALTDAPQQRAENPEFYETCLWQLSVRPTQAQGDIAKDVARTMQSRELFRTQEGMEMLSNILSVFSFRHPRIGYCQSMNIVTAALLLFLPEERTFWVLDHLLTVILPADYYTPSMLDVRVDLRVLAVYIGKRLPTLAAHLRALNVDISVICLPWFLCLYVDVLPPESAFRVWDVLFAEGNTAVLFRVALALLHAATPAILAMTEPGQVFMHLSALPGSVLDCDALLASAHAKPCYLSQEKVDKWRARVAPELQKELLAGIKFVSSN